MTRLAVGFGGGGHDTAVVVADEARILVGIEDERLHRRRHAVGIDAPLARAHAYCLAARPDADGAPWTANRLLSGQPFFADRPPAWEDDQTLHALSVWLTAPFERAAVVVLDGAGDPDAGDPAARITATLFRGDGNRLTRLAQVAGPAAAPGEPAAGLHDNSLGDLYEAVTRAIGFAPLQGGKTMALAAFGDDRFVAPLGRFVAARPGFACLVRLAGADGLGRWLAAEAAAAAGGLPPFDRAAALAFAVQSHLERLAGHLLEAAHRLTGLDDLCLAGSVALNAVLVGRLREISPFRRVHVISAPGDSGTAVGAALLPLAAAAPAGSVRRWPWQPYLGVRHPPPAALPAGLRATALVDPAAIAARLDERLAAGGVVATHVGGSEFGPRALGHRSLLACPYQDGILARLNAIKAREWFRPVAPMRLAPPPPPWTNGLAMMQAAVPVDTAAAPPRAALHVDRTARLQLVPEAGETFADAWLTALLRLRRHRGVPFLCNTSFNGPGEPLVETPAEAIALFQATPGIDALLLDGLLITRTAG
jgi:carbamoyltransferase